MLDPELEKLILDHNLLIRKRCFPDRMYDLVDIYDQHGSLIKSEECYYPTHVDSLLAKMLRDLNKTYFNKEEN